MMTEKEATSAYQTFNNCSIAYVSMAWIALEIFRFGTPGLTIGTAFLCIAYASSIYHIFYYDSLKYVSLIILWDEKNKKKQIEKNKMRFKKALEDAHEVQ